MGGLIPLLFRGGGAGTAPGYTLKWWQSRKFKSLVDLWTPTKTPSGTTWTRSWQDVPCYLERMASASQVEQFGRTEQDDLFTRDEFWFHEHQEDLDDGHLIALKASDRHGTAHPDYDRVWICAGDARVNIDDIGDEGHIEIVAIVQPEAPSGVTP